MSLTSDYKDIGIKNNQLFLVRWSKDFEIASLQLIEKVKLVFYNKINIMHLFLICLSNVSTSLLV